MRCCDGLTRRQVLRVGAFGSLFSLADLLPEVTFHSHDRVWLTAALFLGVALAWGIGFLEPMHAHEEHQHEHLER